MPKRDNPSDKIKKSSLMLHDSVKNSLLTKVVDASRSGQIKLDNKQLEKLLSVLVLAADEGYYKGLNVFSKSISDALSVVNVVELSVPTKKKSDS